jgi:uncharacterized protein YhbP (UPF0306 family)
MSEDLSCRIAQFLDLYRVMSLATCGPRGPHAANLFFARDGLALIWVSETTSRHCENIEADCRAAATVAPDYSDYAIIRGVQLWGSARRIDAAEGSRLLHLLQSRYPFLGHLEDAPVGLRAAFGRVQVYRLVPARIALIDNTKGFGHKEVLELHT